MTHQAPDSFKAATTIVTASIRSRSGGSAGDVEFAKETMKKIKNASASEKNELKRLNAELQSYLKEVKDLEALNKRLIDEVDKARERAMPRLVDKSKLDETLDIHRSKLEDASNHAVNHQARIEEAQSICQHITQRLRFFQNEADLHQQKIGALQGQLNDIKNQREYLLKSAELAKDDINREQGRIVQSEKDLDHLRGNLKDNKTKNKKIEFEMQTILDELEFRKAVFAEEVNDMRTRMNGLHAFTGPDLANFYKTELANAVRQIRQDFHNLNDQQLAEYKQHKETELKVTVQRIEEERNFEQAMRSKLEASKDLEVQSTKELRASADGYKNEMKDLGKRNAELETRLKNLESRLGQLREKNAGEVERKQGEIDSLREQNQQYANELDYWDRVTRIKLEQEIQTYRSILNSQLRLIHSGSLVNNDPNRKPSNNTNNNSSSNNNNANNSGNNSYSGIISDSAFSRGNANNNNRNGSNQAIPNAIIGGRDASVDVNRISSSTTRAQEEELNRQRDEVISVLRQVFDYFDADHSGRINSSELDNVLRRLNVKLSRDSYEQILREADKDLSRDLSFSEFCKIMLPVFTGRFNDDELRFAFKKFDTDNSGFITIDELRSILSKVGQHFSDKQIADMIKSVDTDRDGRLNFQEFARLMKQPRY